MRLEDIKLGVSPLTDRVYLGTVSKKDPGLWLQKRDAVSDVCRVLLEWVTPGHKRTFFDNAGNEFELTLIQIKKAT